jgi:hypothetical protein
MSVTAYEYAMLCVAARQDPDVKIIGLGYKLPEGWEVLTVSGKQDGKDGYFGAVFKKGHDVVVVHRGTSFPMADDSDGIRDKIDDIKDFIFDLNDDFQLWANKAPDQFYVAMGFMAEVVNYMGERDVLSFTGHSLGGLLAQLTAIAFNNKHATVFDSPGAKGVVEHEDFLVVTDELDINIYNAAPNVVNTVSEHIATPISVKVESKIGGPDIMDYFRFSFQQHPIVGIAAKFNKETGTVAAEDIINYDQKWPSGTYGGYKYFASYDHNQEIWDSYIQAQWDGNKKLQKKYGDVDEYKKQFIQFELSSKENTPINVLKNEIALITSNEVDFSDSKIFKALVEVKNLVEGDIEYYEATNLRSFGKIVANHVKESFFSKILPEMKNFVVAKWDKYFDDDDHSIDVLGSDSSTHPEGPHEEL